MVASGSVVLNVWPVEAYCNNLGFPWAIAVVVGVFLVIAVTVPDVRGEVWGLSYKATTPDLYLASVLTSLSPVLSIVYR